MEVGNLLVSFLQTIVEKILKMLARFTIWRYQPVVVGITGSMGKTSTREAIYYVLKNNFGVRRSIKNYNHKLGLPLSILGLESGGKSLPGWIWIFFKSFFSLFLSRKKYPEVLILEIGIEQPGDMSYLASIAKPHIGVVTGIGEIPVHVEFFNSPEALAREKSQLIKILGKKDFAVLNNDDSLVAEMRNKTKARVLTFGLEESADVMAEKIGFNYSFNDRELLGISFKISRQGNTVPFRLKGTLGSHQLYPVLAAIAVGEILELNLVQMADAILDFRAPAGRMRLLSGIKNSFVIDDTYNASPTATQKAVETLKNIPVSGKKIAVLGDMLELGVYTEKAHRKIGRLAFEAADIFVAVGQRMKFAYEEARQVGFAKENSYWFSDANEAKKKVEELVDPDDLILVKGSQGMRMERIVLEIMAEPDKADELLVRQDAKWKRN